MKKRIGVVADDITGANDIGLMFMRSGCNVGIFTYDTEPEPERIEGLDVIIIDTDSRLDRAEVAAEKVTQATRRLMRIPCDLYYNKTCSVFRGNIGAEFDAMQDTLGIHHSMVILGFPENGRTTVNGIHYVSGVKLEDSQFRNDPIHPMRCSNLKQILSAQTCRPVGNLFAATLDQGLGAVRAELELLKKSCAYILFDVRNQNDLRLIAEAVKEEKNLCGSSAIGQELPLVFGSGSAKREQPPMEALQENGTGTLFVAGSLTPQSRAQVEYLSRRGVAELQFQTASVFDAAALEAELHRLRNLAGSVLKGGRDVLIHTDYDAESIRRTKETGIALGLAESETGKRISGAMARAVREIYEQVSFQKLVVAGGDTSAAIAEALEFTRMQLLCEIEAGVPAMLGYGLGRLLLVLKSGSFGSEALLQNAAERLRQIQQENDRERQRYI